MSDNKQNAIIQQERINNFNQGLNQGYIQQFQDSSKKSNGEDSNQKLQNNNNQQQPKRRCNCKQSRCIKLYCECYAYGAYCDGCHCINCLNNANAEGYRQNAIANTLVRNPVAFQPKITVNDTKTQDISSLGKHNKGCACKRSGCMKKYCECFQAGVPCSENCKCTLCQNRVNTQGNQQGRFNFLGGNFIGDDNQKREILKMLVLVGDKKKIDQFIGKQSNFGEQNFQIQDMIQDQSKKLLDIFCASPEELVKNEENVTFLLSMHDQLVADYQTPQKSKFEQVQQQQLPKQNNNQFVQFQKKEQSQKEKINDKNNVQLDYQSEQEQMSQEESDVQQQQEDQKNKEQNNKNDNFNIKLENNASSNSGLNNQQPQIKNFNLLNNTNIHISQEINEPIYNNQSNPNNSIVNTLNNNLQAKRSFTKHINSSDQKINLNQMQSQQTNISQNLSFSNPLGQIINLNVSTSIKEQQDDLEENLTCPEEIEEDLNKQVQQQQKIIDNQNQLLLGEQGINKELQVSLFVFKKKLILNKFIEELRKIESQVGNQIIKKEHENSEQESIQNEEQEQQEFEEIQQQQPNEIEIQQQIQNIQFLKQIQLNQQNEKQINQEKIYSNDNQIEIEEEISEINENLNLKDLNQIQNQNQQQQFKNLQTSNILINQENIQIEQNQEQEQKQQFIQKNDDIQVEDQN